MKHKILGKMSEDHFLKNYWNKKPLLLKKVVKNSLAQLEFNDFFEMATDSYFETRMVYETGGDYPWQAKVGPFKKSDFKKKGKWTLICHNLENVDDDLNEIKSRFNFISNWHFDDVMATISDVGSSVGAHIDDYSVFIFQEKGKRKWLLEENPVHEYLPDLDIRLLKKFNPTMEWILEPGDMLYIPPNVAHHGITMEKSISYSFGFKSIRYNNLLASYVEDIMSDLENSSFHDRKSTKASDPFLVPDYVTQEIHKELIKIFSNKESFQQSLLRFLAAPRNPIEPSGVFSDFEILKRLGHEKIYRDIWSKLVSRKASGSQYQIAINQKTYMVSAKDYAFIQNIFLASPYKGSKITKKELENPGLSKLLLALIKDGVLYFQDE